MALYKGFKILNYTKFRRLSRFRAVRGDPSITSPQSVQQLIVRAIMLRNTEMGRCYVDTERVLFILKPDGVQKKLQKELLDQVDSAGLRVLYCFETLLKTEVAKELMARYNSMWFFEDAVAYLTSGNSLILICEGADANDKAKKIRGNSYEGTGLRKYSSERLTDPNGREVCLKNILHTSDPEDFLRESQLVGAQLNC